MRTDKTTDVTCDIDDHTANSEQPSQPNLNPQVKSKKPRATRRKFSAADKQRILSAYDSFDTPLSRGAFLRENGLYSSSITKWRQQLSGKEANRTQKRADKILAQHNKVVRENASLKKKLQQAEAIIDLQKKVSDLLSVHILQPEKSEES